MTNVRIRLLVAMGVLLVGLLLLATQCPNGSSSLTAVLSANPTSGTSPLTVNFDASSSLGPEGSILTYDWVFGDGNTGTGGTISHTYRQPGLYTAQLSVTDDEGNMDSTSCTITVTAAVGTPPSAGFIATPSSGEVPLAVNFNASASFDPDGSITSYAWSFGDGGNGSRATVTHTYNSAGTYYPLLCVTDNDGNQDYAAQTIRVLSSPSGNNPPTASFTASPTSGQAPLAVSFNASGSSDSDGSITSYVWSFGDGGGGSGVTKSHTYNSVGTYAAQLTVTDDDGATDSATRTIQVSATPVSNNPPTASFTASPTSGQAPLAVSFNASASSDSDGSITSYVWNFGDGGGGSGVTKSHTYNSVGTYTTRLTITDDDGATDSTTRTIQVSAAPVAQDLYVNADSGSDTIGNGTSSNPFQTITRALAATEVTPGIDAIHIATGIYNTVLGELFPLRCVEVNLLGEGTTPDDVRIIGTVNVLWNSSLQNVRCFTNVTVGGTDALVRNVVLKDDTYPVAIFANGTRLVVEDCLIETGVGGIKASGDEITIRNNDVRHTNRYGWYGVYVMDGNVVVTGNSIENEQKGLEMKSGVAESNTLSNCEQGISIDGTTSPVVLRGNSISDDLAGNNTNVAEGIVVRGNAEVILENNSIGPVDDSGVSIFDTAIVDLGGGTLGSTGGNTLSGSLPNILDDRVAFSGAIYAKQNVWDNPQPAGTVDGPILNSPNYRIIKEGNTIIFSD